MLWGAGRRISDIGQGAINEVVQSHQTAIQHSPCSATQSHIASFNGRKGEHCGIKEIAQFVRKIS